VYVIADDTTRPVAIGTSKWAAPETAIELMQVVWHPTAEIDQPLATRGLGVDRVVDAGQKHRLIQQHNACIGELPIAAATCVSSSFA